MLNLVYTWMLLDNAPAAVLEKDRAKQAAAAEKLSILQASLAKVESWV